MKKIIISFFCILVTISGCTFNRQTESLNTPLPKIAPTTINLILIGNNKDWYTEYYADLAAKEAATALTESGWQITTSSRATSRRIGRKLQLKTKERETIISNVKTAEKYALLLYGEVKNKAKIKVTRKKTMRGPQVSLKAELIELASGKKLREVNIEEYALLDVAIKSPLAGMPNLGHTMLFSERNLEDTSTVLKRATRKLIDKLFGGESSR